jgi:glutamyl-tRNA synthetase
MPAADVFVPKKRTVEETVAFAGEQLAVLEGASWNAEAIEAAMKELGVAKEWSVKENFMLLRAIVTGKTASPPLLESLVVFGKARTLDRVRRFVDGQKKLANLRK